MSRQEIKQHYNRLSKNGPYSTLAQYNKGGYKSQYISTVFDEAILPHFTDNAHHKVLDFGCAAGTLTDKLADIAHLAVGVDISAGMLELAKGIASTSDRQAAYVRIDGSKIPFKNHQFNSVITRETFCHVVEDDFPEVIAEINRVLCENGLFFCVEQVSESSCWRYSQNPFNIRRSIAEITEQIKTNGFECVDAYVVRQPRFFWIYLFWFRLLPKRLMRPLARLEIKFNRRFSRLETNRWQNVLFIFKKV